MANPGRRRNRRVPLRSPIQVSWLDTRGKPHCIQALAIDISESGIRFELPEAVADAVTVQMRSELLGLTCTGLVRTCVRAGTRYTVGIEFTGKTRFDRVSAGIERVSRRETVR